MLLAHEPVEGDVQSLMIGRGEFVLIDTGRITGASNVPEVTAQATSHGDTMSLICGQRRPTASAAAKIATTASATSDPAGSNSGGSTATATSNLVNTART